ncbi:MAG: hypothetical protein ACI87J_000150 [Colwellia sp.]|jgi:hypothetical protein
MISNSLWLTVSCGVTNTKPNPKDSRHLLANVRKVAKGVDGVKSSRHNI